MSETLGETDFHRGQTFTDVDFTGRTLDDVELLDCELVRVKFANARWNKVRLESCVVVDSDLTQLVLAKVSFRGVRFEGCKLMGVEFRDLAASPEVEFDRCDLRYASFVDLSLHKTRFEKCIAREANFLGTDLTDSRFNGTDLTAAVFRDSVLERVDFSGCTGLFLEPGKNRMKGAKVPVETAVLLAEAAGLSVDGYSAEEPAKPARGKGRR